MENPFFSNVLYRLDNDALDFGSLSGRYIVDCLFVLSSSLAYSLVTIVGSSLVLPVLFILFLYHYTATATRPFPLQQLSAAPRTLLHLFGGLITEEVQSWLLRGEGWFAGINYIEELRICSKEKKKKKSFGRHGRMFSNKSFFVWVVTTTTASYRRYNNGHNWKFFASASFYSGDDSHRNFHIILSYYSLQMLSITHSICCIFSFIK